MINRTYGVLDRLRPVRFILLAVFLAVASGCNSSRSENGPSDAGNASDQQGNTQANAPATSETAAGTLDGGGAERAADGNAKTLPEGVLAYPDAVRVESLRIASQNKESKAPPGVVMFVSTEPDVMKVANWYEKELVSAGWAVVERSGDGEFCLFQKTGREMSVSVGAIPDPKPDGHADAQLLIVIDANQ